MDKTLKLINIVKNYPVVWQTDRKEYGPFAIAPDKEYGRKGSSYTEIPKVNKDFRETKINS